MSQSPSLFVFRFLSEVVSFPVSFPRLVQASRCLLVLRIISVPSSSCRASRFIHLVKRLVSIRLVFIVPVLFPLRLRFRPRLSCFVDEGMKERNEDEGDPT